MTAKKILVLPLCLSIAGHLAVLALIGLPGTRPVRETGPDVLTVDLKKNVDGSRSRKDGKSRPAVHRRAPIREIAGTALRGGDDADMVDLGDTDSPYSPYLRQLKRKIEKVWMYPEGAFARKEEGVTVVRFTVVRNGMLGEISLMASSGSSLLDEGTLGTIRAAAPYEPLPAAFRISRLNIVAAFRYRLAE